MSIQPPGEDQRELPLPSPRSPRELDDRILAHARNNAPPKHGARPLAWTGGLATAAVLVVAVYLVNLTDTGTVAQSPVADTVQEDESAGAAATLERVEISTAKIQAEPRPKLKMSAAARSDADFAAEGVAEETATAAAAAPSATEARAHNPGPGVSKALLRLRQLVAADKLEQAEQEYAELRRSCADCNLPEDLENALAMLPQNQQ